MKKIWCVIAVLLATNAMAKENIFKIPAEHMPVKMLAYNKETLVVTPQSVSRLVKGKPEVIVAAGGITDAVVTGNELWLATYKGVQKYELGKKAILKQTYFQDTRIAALALDTYHRLWVATSFKGVFMQQADSFEKKVNIPGAYSLACTPDSNIWVGTNVGLYRIAANDFSTTRYAEEGYSGYELPDNLVERLYADDASNVWVVMPDNISFKSNKKYQGELPSYAYVGDKNNELKKIVTLKGSSYLFITQKGMYFLPSTSLKEEHHHGGSEIFSGDDAQAFAINGKHVSMPSKLTGASVQYAERVGNDLYFVTEKGGWKIKEKDFIKQITRK